MADLAQELFACTDVDQVRRVLASAGIQADPTTAEPKAPAYHVPGPYEIALQLGCALASTGRYETPGAALVAAWTAVPEYWQGRDFYLSQIVPVLYGNAAPQAATPEEPAAEEFKA